MTGALFTHSNGNVYLGAIYLSPALAHSLRDVFLNEGGNCAVSGDLATYHSVIDLHHSLHDAMALAAQHSPEKWREALGFIPSRDEGSVA